MVGSGPARRPPSPVRTFAGLRRWCRGQAGHCRSIPEPARAQAPQGPQGLLVRAEVSRAERQRRPFPVLAVSSALVEAASLVSLRTAHAALVGADVKLGPRLCG